MSTVYKILTGELGFSVVDPAVAVAAATLGDYDDFSCVVQAAAIIATPQSDTEPIDPTFCATGSEAITPKSSTFELQATVLQDPQDDTPSGLAKFLWDNESGESGLPVFFYLALASGAAPKAIGSCFISPMDFGGPARTALTAQLNFPIDGRPDIEFGTTADV